MTRGGPQAARPRLSAIVIPPAARMDTDDAVAALTRHTPDSVDIRTMTIGDANAAVDHTGPRHLCLLDSRAHVQPGWCEPLLELLEAPGGRSDAVAASPCVVDADGNVVDAGTMVTREGMWYPIGAGVVARDPSVRFARVVDGSSRILVVDRDAFLRVGGFDQRFTTFPAAAMDLCVRLAEHGGTVWYVPASRVTWVPAPLDAAIAQRIEKDRARVGERYPARFASRPGLENLDEFPHHAVATRDALALDRVLVIDDRVPHHDRGAGDARMRQMIEEMVMLWPQARITFLAADGIRADRYAPALLEQGIEVVWPSDVDGWLETRFCHYSIVVVSRPDNFRRYDAAIRRTQPQALRVFDVEALFHRRLERTQAVTESPADREALRELVRRDRSWEFTAVAEADAAWCVTAEEQAVLSAVAPFTRLFPVTDFSPLGTDPRGFAARHDLLFFGGFLAGAGSPNEDAVVYVVEEIMPRLWKHDPALKLHVVGADPTPAVRSLDSELVQVVGHVDDPRSWLDGTLVHLAPMRFGSGLKHRFVETIAAGQPFVTSSVGAEGLGLGELTDALVADTADGQASLVLELLNDRSRWEHVQRGLLAIAAERFSRERFRSDLLEAMSHLGVAPPVGLGAA